MAIDKDTISNMIYDPTSMQKYILDYLDSASSGSLSVVEPTNPFSMAIETSAVLAAAAVQETSNQLRKQYPNLATTEEELYHHISENESSYIYSVPSECKLNFFVNLLDLRMNGVQDADGTYRETIIPSGTAITVLDVTMTLLNDILVRLYNNNDVFVEQQLDSNNDIAYEDVGILDANIITDTTGNTSWIVFSTYVKQVTKKSINKSVIASTGFSQVVSLTDKFCHTVVSYKKSTSSSYTVLPKMFNDEYVDPVTPGCIVKVYQSNIWYKIPDHYILEGYISGNINIDLYETKGHQYLPVHKYNVSDFSYVLGDTSKNSQAATSKNIAIMINAGSVLEGGSNALETMELRDIIINNATGDIDLPITEKQIERYGDISGYTIVKVTDTVTEREFLGLKAVPEFSSNLISANHNIFFNSAKIVLGELDEHANVIVNSDNFVIKSNTVFKNNNGTFEILTGEELDYLDKITTYTLKEYMQANKLFFNPFYYLVEKQDNYINSRVYDLDNPEVLSNMIKEKNITLQERVNVKNYSIIKSATGYTFSVSLTTNTAYDKLDIKNSWLQIKIPIPSNKNIFTYIDGVYDATKEIYNFEIKSNLCITSDDTLDLLNGTSELSTKTFDLISDITLYICSKDSGVSDPTYFLQTEVSTSSKHYVVFTKEQYKIRFGQELKYIYNNLYNVYAERKYKVYEEDIPMVYEEDVYEVDPDTGCIVSVETITGSQARATYKIAHAKGDPVLDDQGEPVLLYKKGDNVIGDDGNPVVDLDSGVIRYIDMLMLEYEFRLSKNNAYNNYTTLVIETLKAYILEELEEMNNKLLEKTVIRYKSFNTTNNLTIQTNNVISYISNNCSPRVELYVSSTATISNETKNNYITTIGNILNEHFSNSKIVLEDIRNSIKEKLGANISSVKVSGIDSNNSEVIVIKDNDNRLYVNKLLDVNKNNELIVVYDINLDITYI